MAKAEQIILTNHPNVKKIAVIAGVWVRAYYAKLGYTLEWEYMVKILNKM
jgi:histone acetyltransferase (RNA polymerase elongator complex component)